MEKQLGWGSKFELDEGTLKAGHSVLFYAKTELGKGRNFRPIGVCILTDGSVQLVDAGELLIHEKDGNVLYEATLQNMKQFLPTSTHVAVVMNAMAQKTSGQFVPVIKFLIQRNDGFFYSGLLEYNLRGFFKKKLELGTVDEMIMENNKLFDAWTINQQ